MPDNATRITINWEDGLRHEWNRCRDGTWDLELTTVGGIQRITGYKRGDLERVIGTALEGTPKGES